MVDTVRVGVVGTSRWADAMHLPILKSHARAELAAVCGRNRARAEEMAAKYAIPQVFTDYRDMIAHGSLQALVIAVPDDLHYAVTMAALDAGLHVLCEKPLALSAGEAKAMLERAEAAGVKHMVYFTYRWLPAYCYARQLIQEGYVGRCLHCQFRYLGGYGRGGDYRWRFDGRRSRGVLSDLGSHMIDLAQWLVGDIARVSGHLATFVDRPGPDGAPLEPANDAAVAALQFVGGAQGLIEVSAVAHVGEHIQEQHVVLHGDEGTLEIDVTFPELVPRAEMRGVHGGEDTFHTLEIPGELWGDPAQRNPNDLFMKQSVGPRLFIDAILEDRPAVPTFYDGYRAQAVIDAVIESHERGAWVKVG